MIDPLTFIALLPAVVLVVYIYRKDRTDKEPTALLAKLLGFGAQGFGAGVKFIQLAGNACIVAFRRLILALLVPHRILCAAE